MPWCVWRRCMDAKQAGSGEGVATLLGVRVAIRNRLQSHALSPSRWQRSQLVSLVQSVTWGLPILLLLLVVLLRSVRVAVYVSECVGAMHGAPDAWYPLACRYALVGVCGVVIFVQGFEAHFLGWTLGPEVSAGACTTSRRLAVTAFCRANRPHAGGPVHRGLGWFCH